MHDYVLKRSKRKTLSIEITKDCKVLVRAPERLSVKAIEDAVKKNAQWIENHLLLQKERNESAPVITQDDIIQLKNAAKAYIPPRVEYYAQLMGADYSGVKITSAKTRYGSCSGTNSLCFSYYLMLKAPEAIDYVIVHELAHTFEHNHGKAFYKIIAEYMPDYKRRVQMLKENRFEG